MPAKLEEPMEKIVVVGLGYVGLPVALTLAEIFPGTVGLDINRKRIAALNSGIDGTGEVSAEQLHESSLTLTTDPVVIQKASIIIVTVPTPIDEQKKPDLRILKAASKTVGEHVSAGAIVVYESTVFPGATEEVCGPILAAASGLTIGTDLFLAYSPERINPGDKEHRFSTITKVVAANHPDASARVAALYGSVVTAGIHIAPSIAVAEMAKVIENTQRDLNIALMNEVSLICARLDISTQAVLEAAGTKWNFLKFTPGLVGGHCIGVDPYYLTDRAISVGYTPEVILAGRRINDSMGPHVATTLMKKLTGMGVQPPNATIGILGATFKENVPDIRNSRVVDIVNELRDWGVSILVHDPWANPEEAAEELGLPLSPLEDLTNLDALIIAVPHRQYHALGAKNISAMVRKSGILFDVKWLLSGQTISSTQTLLSL
jgi:UDP-N-acetyl-D-galactosamine dehydrogenase